MHGIYIMAVITSLGGAALAAGMILSLAERDDRRILALAALLALPLSPVVLYVVRVPILNAVNPLLEPGSAVGLFVQLLYAPLTEEPAKLLPLLIPALGRRLTAKNAAAFASALGGGFALGEVWLVAFQVAQAPAYAGMPFYVFTGFLVERLTVLPVHAFFTAAALRGITGGRPGLGTLGAMALHWLGNAPIALRVLDVGRLGETAWTMLIAVGTELYCVIGVIILILWTLGPLPRRAHTHARCPECGTVYPRPVLVMNLPTKRYERCPNCQHWHWIDRRADPGPLPGEGDADSPA